MGNKDKVELGDEVRHTISGFKGIVASEHRYISGCNRYAVQPKVGADKKLPEMASFDEHELVVITKNAAGLKKDIPPVAERKPGGPAKFMPADKSMGERR